MLAPRTTILLPSHSTDSTHAIIRNPTWLFILRLSWLLLVAGYVLLAIVGIPILYEFHNSAPAQIEGFASSLSLHSDLLAILYASVVAIAVLIATATAGIVFYGRSNSWLVWFVSVTMPLATVAGCSIPIYVAAERPELRILTWFFLYCAQVAYSISGWILPDGNFFPRWSRWLLPVFLLWWLMSLPLMVDLGIPGDIQRLLNNINVISMAVVGFMTIGAQINRYRHASVFARQQLKWVFFGIFVWFGFFVISIVAQGFLLPELEQATASSVVYFAFLMLPGVGSIIYVMALAFAVQRNRLWDVDIIINRSLVGATVTGVMALVFIASVFVIQRIIGAENTLAAFIASAIGPAVLFNPTRKRVRQLVDRRIYGLAFDLHELHAAHKEHTITNPGALSGVVIGEFQILDVIGKGGMGEIYLGEGSSQKVAIKTMLPDIAKNLEMRTRFMREAEIGKRLDHPHIAKVYTNGNYNGTPYLVMEYVGGGDVSQRLKQGEKYDIETATTIMRQVCAALEVAHQQGYVHRDIKPSNVMLRENGEAVLMDFGITKVDDASLALTGTGAIGTITYMAPEQIRAAKDVDQRADIYALGIMLYEMLTGRPPFVGGPAQVMFSHLQQPAPDPGLVEDSISDELSDGILKALAKDPDDRFQSASDFAEALVI